MWHDLYEGVFVLHFDPRLRELKFGMVTFNFPLHKGISCFLSSVHSNVFLRTRGSLNQSNYHLKRAFSVLLTPYQEI